MEYLLSESMKKQIRAFYQDVKLIIIRCFCFCGIGDRWRTAISKFIAIITNHYLPIFLLPSPMGIPQWWPFVIFPVVCPLVFS